MTAALVGGLVLAWAPTDAAGQLFAELSVFRDPPGTFVDYEVSSEEIGPPLRIRVTVMDFVPGGPVPARWTVMTLGVGMERFEAWALAEQGPGGLPVRRRGLVRIGEKVAPWPAEAPSERPAPRSAKPEWKGRARIRTPAGEFDCRVAVLRVEGAELRVWLSKRAPMGGPYGGIVRMQAVGGARWDLAESGVEKVRSPPAPTESAAVAPAPEEADDASPPGR